MNISKNAVLMLCCPLGQRGVRPLTAARFRDLRGRLGDRSLDEFCTLGDLTDLGYDEQQAEELMFLLSRRQVLEDYLRTGEAMGITAITCVCKTYPARLRYHNAQYHCPVLFANGDLSLLQKKAVSVVGSRDLQPRNRIFAQQAGTLAAKEGYVLVSGGAKGADTAAQLACMEHGGSCAIFLPDELARRAPEPGTVYLSAYGYDQRFSTFRAHHRNILIHMMGEKTFAAQSSCGRGGTWQGCTENLRHRWSELYVCDDGSEAAAFYCQHGATALSELTELSCLTPDQCSLF